MKLKGTVPVKVFFAPIHLVCLGMVRDAFLAPPSGRKVPQKQYFGIKWLRVKCKIFKGPPTTRGAIPNQVDPFVILKLQQPICLEEGVGGGWKFDFYLLIFFQFQGNPFTSLEGYRVYGICQGPTPTIHARYTMNQQ